MLFQNIDGLPWNYTDQWVCKLKLSASGDISLDSDGDTSSCTSSFFDGLFVVLNAFDYADFEFLFNQNIHLLSEDKWEFQFLRLLSRHLVREW